MGVGFAFRPLQPTNGYNCNGTELKIKPGSAGIPAVLLAEKAMHGSKSATRAPGGYPLRVQRKEWRRRPKEFIELLRDRHAQIGMGGWKKADLLVDSQSADWLIRNAKSLLKGRNGNTHGKKGKFAAKRLASELLPPISERQALGLVEYYYYGGVLRKDPGNEDARQRMLVHRPSITSGFAGLKGEDLQHGLKLLHDVKMMAFLQAKKIAGEKKKLDAALAEIDRGLREEIRLLEERKGHELKGIAKTYEAKKELLGKVIAKKLPGFKQTVKAALTVGVSITASTVFTDWVKALVQHLPHLGSAPPAAIGPAIALGIMATWAAVKGLKAAIDWHFTVVSWRLGKKQARDENKVAAGISAEKDDRIYAYKCGGDLHLKKFEKIHTEIVGQFKEEYARLISEHGYASPN